MNRQIVLALVILLSGCNSAKHVDQALIARNQVDLFYSLLEINVDSAIGLFGHEIMKDISRDKLRSAFLNTRKMYGPTVKKEFVKLERLFGTNHGTPNNNLVLYYRNTYQSGIVTVEQFVFNTDDTGNDFKAIDGWSCHEWGKAPRPGE